MAKKNADEQFIIEISKFYQGFAPDAHLDSLTEFGNSGHASSMTDVDVISKPKHITQGPGLSALTNGTQAGVVNELINFIMQEAIANDATYGIGPTKLHKISATTVSSGGSPSWPRTVANMTDGESIVRLLGVLYYLYNKSSGGDIGSYDLASTFDDNWGSDIPTGKAALEKALHPVAKKEDMFGFGNGRYAGFYVAATDTLSPQKLDFGTDAEVADIVFNANHWLIAVNYGVTGTNRNVGQIYLYEGAAVSTLLADEVAVGVQRIGFIFPINGVVYLAYQDLSSSGGYKIGYISGRRIVDLKHFTGSLPSFAQKTLYKNLILFVSSGKLWTVGAVIDELPIQISQLADGGEATVGALAAPFGTPMVASTDGASAQQLAKFSGFTTASRWRSKIITLTEGRLLGYIDEIVIITTELGDANAQCDIQLEYNQQQSTSGTAKVITGTGTRIHRFDIGDTDIEDVNIFLSWANGDATTDCPIRKIYIIGHFVKV